MAVGVVAGDAPTQPQHVADAQGLAEDGLVVAPREARVADLHHAVEQALLGGEQGARPVDVDAAAFEHHLAAVVED